jgi:hypothetical protein
VGRRAHGAKVIEAENSDLFDVLAYVAFAAEPVTRAERAAAGASAATAAEFTDKQQAFVDFVLAQYVSRASMNSTRRSCRRCCGSSTRR